MRRDRPLHRFPGLIAVPLLAAALSACSGGPALPDAVRGLAGLRPPAQSAPRNVTLRLDAARRLNVEKHGQPLALVVRIYTLRQHAAFDAAPYAAFLAPDTERAALGPDLVDVRELTLVPGQRVESTQQLAPDAGFVGVVALYHTPAPGGWRLVVPASEAARAPLALELGACALRQAGGPSGSLVRCQ